MQKTKIEWCDYTWNPIKGYCPNDCPYCYSHRIYNRFKWDKELRYEFDAFDGIDSIKEPSRIFAGSMIDIQHHDIPRSWVEWTITLSKDFPQHTFITLTKFPENLRYFDFPKNWWIGTTVDEYCHSRRISDLIHNSIRQNIRFISFEPLLTPMYKTPLFKELDWIIIGGKSPGPVHKKEWIDDIVHRADKLNIPVFIKSNANYIIERKEFPV